MKTCKPLLLILAVAFALTAPARATWSIVLVDTRTGEMGVACASCVNFDLRSFVPVVRVGQGVAAAQSVVDQGSTNRKRIRKGLIGGRDPAAILDALSRLDPQHENRQYGIVDLVHDPVTFTGSGAGQHARGKCGQVGDLKYAVQGNLLTGAPVVIEAERAVIETEGDLSQKLMAAMEAARAFGGDGRCSCPNGLPTSCGSPPQAFGKSAQDAFIIVSRVGDSNGTCGGIQGCASGNYYLNLHAVDGVPLSDPVMNLQLQYDAWRASQVGRPDHMNSTVHVRKSVLEGNGVDRSHVLVILRDIEGDQLPFGGLDVLVQQVGSSTPHVTVGPVRDEGEGRYSFDFVAGTESGQDTWRVLARDDFGGVVLNQTIQIAVRPRGLSPRSR